MGLAIIILWQMLKPGYILTLDMIFMPNLENFLANHNFYNTYPFYYLLHLLNFIVPAWLIQKLILTLLFFGIGYLAFKYLPVSKKYYIQYWAGTFYTVNPFVYERFLAGHWQLLTAYAFLPPFISYLLKLYRLPTWRNLTGILICLFIIGIFSLHFLTMDVLLLFVLLIVKIISYLIACNYEKLKNLLKYGCILVFGIAVLSCYWLIPFILNNQKSPLDNFTPENIQLFKTSNDQRLGAVLNVLSLYGFWQESQPWANYWLWPKDNFIFWWIIAVFIFFLTITGLIYGLQKPKRRKQTIFFLILGLAAFIFSLGLVESIFKNINQWLFDNVFFWRGFRDSNKFSAFLVLSYAYFGSRGVYVLMNRLKNQKFKHIALAVIFLIPFLYTYPMLGGLARQLQPVWYPDSWNQTNEIIKQDQNDYKILFLPWHGYLSFDFNHKLILANPAAAYFGKKIIQSQNMELNPKGNNFNAFGYQQVENLIINEKQLRKMEILNILQSENIKYIIRAKDLGDQDIYRYDFLKSDYLWTIFDMPEITLYQVQNN